MKNQLDKIRNFISFLRNDDVSMDTKSLYLVVIYSIIVNAVFTVFFIIKHASVPFINFSICMLIFFLIMLYLIGRFEETAIFKYVVVILLNFILYPLIFFLTGAITGGAMLYFPLGIVITFFLIREKWAYLLFVLELGWYSFILALPIVNYKYIPKVASDNDRVNMPVAFVAAAWAPIFIFIYQTVIYERTKKLLNDSSRVIETARYNKSRFLANVTHEIRTPMNAIIGMNELILREETDPETRELAENIKVYSNQLLKIINNVLEFSKLDSNKMDLYPAKYDFTELINEIIDAVSNEYAEENVDFTAKIDNKIPRCLFGDNLRIKQVFMYLLFSSVHRMPHSRMVMEVSGETDINTNTVKLSCSISQSGYGLSETEIEAMLSAYAKYDSRQKSDYRGMGLELSICKEILELMGGTLSIKSIEGVGMCVNFEFMNYIIEDTPIVRISPLGDYNILVYTKNPEYQDIWTDILARFSLYPNFVNGPNAFRGAIENKRYTHIFIDDMFYPMLKDTIKSAQIKDEVYVITEAGSVYRDFDDCKILRKPMTCINVANALNNIWDAESYKLAQKKEAVTYPEGKAIIVDDSLVNLKLLEGMLQTFNMSITTCKSGAEALDVLEHEEYDIIILDQRMPEMDGIELLHLIRKLDNANAMVPILCATADFGPDVSRMLLNEGFQDYLAKPVRRFYLERMLRKYMPSELAVNIVIDEVADTKPEERTGTEEEAPKDPCQIDFDQGLANVGGITDAFATVVNAYYKEGLTKLDSVPKLLAEGRTSDYITAVHALKSSSAAIGATAMSLLFRELEFAGKANNIEFIEGHTDSVIDNFRNVLEVVRKYLEEKGMLESDEETAEPEGEEVAFDDGIIDELIAALSNFNIRETEEKVRECLDINYGHLVNETMRNVNSQLEVFDYHKAKELLVELKRRRNESGI